MALFNTVKYRKYTKNQIDASPNWNVAWGKLDTRREDLAWEDDKVSIFIPNSHTPAEKFLLSPQQQFVVVGDAWLSNGVELLQKLGMQSTSFFDSHIQLVANLWERWGDECLMLLVGMFALVVWDRQKQILYLGRDRIGAHTLYYTPGTTRWIAPKLRNLAPYHSTNLDLVALR